MSLTGPFIYLYPHTPHYRHSSLRLKSALTAVARATSHSFTSVSAAPVLDLRANILRSNGAVLSMPSVKHFSVSHSIRTNDAKPAQEASVRARFYAEIQKGLADDPILSKREDFFPEVLEILDVVESGSGTMTEATAKFDDQTIMAMTMKMVQLQSNPDAEVSSLASAAAAQLLKAGAARNNTDAMFGYANLQRNGIFGVEKDINSAVEAFTILAKKGHRFAQTILGEIYFNGENEEINTPADAVIDAEGKKMRRYEMALSLFETAAKNKVPNAYHFLGEMYSNGLGCEKDMNKAIESYKQGFEAGFHQSALALARAYSQPGPEQSYHDAFEWHTKGAEMGNLPCLYNLGTHHFQGKGTPQDFSKAADCWQHAADQGFLHAMINLANLYVEGRGVPQDLYRARDLYKLASEKEPSAKVQYLELEDLIRKAEAAERSAK
ncbi:hypothetical protein SARC_01178 [Sphaeroforma arctica JP610]|uniref:Uncharacterized protein n=1 Tax=Sphaeroforma arctica JP610 TaxID=667725 RepID=A0A0L0GCD9_9EUKA|nr:hypothetical protein SARC_01178 [Sphaeroforma arctica JP610]KNC86672.1 hypothetical protein SARC_01178 [Sphaeroforma arctica JP610]|eukprot:XP_014160574.1 hypothetical protein SARC_01178 [Sphaeroforma arctica JP610]